MLRTNGAPLSRNEAPPSLLALLHASRHSYQNQPALWIEGRTFTYSELYDGAGRLASVIQAARGRDACYQRYQCGLLVNRTLAAYAAVLASLMVGSAY